MDAFWIAYGVEWMNLVVRWLHVITGIAWIGASFYFVWLDNNIRPPAAGSALAEQGVSGELWAVHGGGFYNPQKYLIAPKTLPQHLHWFKWEAYSTWLSGFALLTIVYYFNAQAMLVDRSVADLSSLQAIGIGLTSLVASWAVYDGLCRSPLAKREGLFGIVVFLLLTAAAFGLSRWLSGRAAYIHVGAMIGTIMVGNVLMVIIPGQKKLVAAMREGSAPDPIHGQRGKQRSVHNNYFTLPVLFIMISNHYAMTYNHRHGWLVLAAIMAAGVLIRHFFNLRHRGIVDWRFPAAGVAVLIGLAIAIAPTPPAARAAGSGSAMTGSARFAAVHQVINQRCVACHAAQPTQPGFAAAPAGILLDQPEAIVRQADKIYQQAVQLRAMPIGNLTGITEEERAVIAAWHDAGSPGP